MDAGKNEAQKKLKQNSKKVKFKGQSNQTSLIAEYRTEYKTDRSKYSTKSYSPIIKKY